MLSASKFYLGNLSIKKDCHFKGSLSLGVLSHEYNISCHMTPKSRIEMHTLLSVMPSWMNARAHNLLSHDSSNLTPVIWVLSRIRLSKAETAHTRAPLSSKTNVRDNDSWTPRTGDNNSSSHHYYKRDDR